MTRLFPDEFEYEPVAPLYTMSIDEDGISKSGIFQTFADAHADIYKRWCKFGLIVDSAGHPVACYREGFMIGVSSLFEFISQLTVDNATPWAYDAMLTLEMFWRINWPEL